MSHPSLPLRLVACLAVLCLAAPLCQAAPEDDQAVAEAAPAYSVPAYSVRPATPAPAAVAASPAAAESATCDKCDGECECPNADATVSSEREPSPNATHKQVGLIKVVVDDLPNTTLNCFCLSLDGRVLAGCGNGEENGEIRVFEADGSYVETWTVPVNVEAINVRASDGLVFVAGDGKLVKFSPQGNLIDSADSPHVTQLDTEKLREEAIAQAKQMYEVYKQQIDIYDQQVERLDKQITKMEEQIAELDNAEGEDTEQSAQAAGLKQQIAQFQAQQEQMVQIRDQWKEQVADMDEEPSDEYIDQSIKSALQRKRAVASISAVGDTVYLGCSSPVGYGYSVWKCSEDFAEGEEIVSGLRGCCGQMDVQASEDGVYVAENARHRVARFDDAGELVGEWGGRVRDDSDLDGFGSCCNPMNVAFGPGGNVYTAEDTTGRIKCYSPDGELLSHVGHADLVPGCKKVSIGVSGDGEHVYMLDITRNHIVHMQRMSEEEATARATEEEAQRQARRAAEGERQAQNSVFGFFVDILTD